MERSFPSTMWLLCDSVHLLTVLYRSLPASPLKPSQTCPQKKPSAVFSLPAPLTFNECGLIDALAPAHIHQHPIWLHGCNCCCVDQLVCGWRVGCGHHNIVTHRHELIQLSWGVQLVLQYTRLAHAHTHM